MHAIEVAQTGGPEVLKYVERPKPAPRSDEVLIQADAIGVNYIDTYFRSGQYPRELPFVLGMEVCGTVAAVGDDVAAIKAGDRVVTANANGAYAEFCTAPADFVAYVPDAVQSDAVASAVMTWACSIRQRRSPLYVSASSSIACKTSLFAASPIACTATWK